MRKRDLLAKIEGLSDNEQIYFAMFCYSDLRGLRK